MASRLTGAVGGRGRLLEKGERVIKGPVFTNTTPRHIKPGHRRPLAPSSAAPTMATCAEPGSTHKAGHHGVLPRAASQQHDPAALSLPRHHHCFTVWNRKYFDPPHPPTPCFNLKECH